MKVVICMGVPTPLSLAEMLFDNFYNRTDKVKAQSKYTSKIEAILKPLFVEAARIGAALAESNVKEVPKIDILRGLPSFSKGIYKFLQTGSHVSDPNDSRCQKGIRYVHVELNQALSEVAQHEINSHKRK
jgi:hypothetical protein